MKILFSILIIIVGGLIALPQALDQYAIASCGEYSSYDDITLSWTIGEILSETYQNGSNVLSQGFQQGDVRSDNSVKNIYPEYEVAIYPNPVKDFLYLKCGNKFHTKITTSFYDFNGKQLSVQQFEGRKITARLDMEQIKPGNYLIKVFDNISKQNVTYCIYKYE